jgi:hypothetical protein
LERTRADPAHPGTICIQSGGVWMIRHTLHGKERQMRALVVARQKTPPPMEMMPTILEGFHQWRVQYRDQMDHFSFFAGGTGGCGIVTVDNEMDLHKLVASWPLTLYSDMLVEVLVDGDEALQFLIESVQAQPAQIT